MTDLEVNGQKKRKRSPAASSHHDAIEDVVACVHGPPEDNIIKSVTLRSGEDDKSERSEKRFKSEQGDDLDGSSQHSIKTKHPVNLAQLPPELWRHVFSFVSPLSLGRLLRVSRTFHRLLNPAGSPLPASDVFEDPSTFRDQNHIWASSRRLFYPTMPRPLFSRSELDLWRLIREQACEFCRRKAIGDPPNFVHVPWSAGPGSDTVRIIWSFGARSCGACLGSRLVKVTITLRQ